MCHTCRHVIMVACGDTYSSEKRLIIYSLDIKGGSASFRIGVLSFEQ
jgi:hypothetical protein